jgi:hypothetical protein
MQTTRYTLITVQNSKADRISIVKIGERREDNRVDHGGLVSEFGVRFRYRQGGQAGRHSLAHFALWLGLAAHLSCQSTKSVRLRTRL